VEAVGEISVYCILVPHTFSLASIVAGVQQPGVTTAATTATLASHCGIGFDAYLLKF
jgi:hypothetical protein